MEEKRALVRQFLDNPFHLGTAEQIAIVTSKSINFILAAKAAGAPFPGNVTRPEWLLEWLRQNPDFTVKHHTSKPKLRVVGGADSKRRAN